MVTLDTSPEEVSNISTKKLQLRLCLHSGTEEVKVGQHIVRAGGIMYPGFYTVLDQPDTLAVTLTDKLVIGPNEPRYQLIWLPLKDFGGVPANWRQTLEGIIIPQLEAGKQVLAFCEGGHGRTGTFLGSLVALLEDSAETPDPIEAVRQRYCRKAVETQDQVDGILALRP